MTIYSSHVDDGGDTIAASQAFITTMEQSALNQLQQANRTDNSHREFLIDICDRASRRLGAKYSNIMQAQAHQLSHDAIHHESSDNIKSVAESFHIVHAPLHGAGLVLGSIIHTLGHPLELLAVLTQFFTVTLEQYAHHTKSNHINSHPAKLIKDLTQTQFQQMFRAMALDVIASWAHKIPSPEQHEREEVKEDWINVLTSTFESALMMLSEHPANMSPKDAIERSLLLIKNIGRRHYMYNTTYRVADYSYALEVHNILEDITPVAENDWALTAEVVDYILENRQLSGRFIFDVMNTFLQPNQELAARHQFITVCMFQWGRNVEGLRTHFGKINRAIAYISENLVLAPVHQYNIPNYARQKKLAETLLFNYIKKNALEDLGDNYPVLKTINFQHSSIYPDISVDYSEGESTFQIRSFIDLFGLVTIEGLQQDVAVKRERITQLETELSTTQRQLATSETRNQALQAEVTSERQRADLQTTRADEQTTRADDQTTRADRLQDLYDRQTIELERLREDVRNVFSTGQSQRTASSGPR